MNSRIHHWVSKIGPPQYLNIDRGTEHLKSDMAICCTLFDIRHYPRISLASWRNGLFENLNKNLGTLLRLLLHDTDKNWSTQAHFFACAPNNESLSHLYVSQYELVFYTQTPISLNFHLHPS